LLSTGVKLWLWDKADFDNLWTLDTNTIYAPITWMGGGGWYTPTANTVAYFPFIDDALDHSWNNYTLISTSITQQSLGYLAWGICKVQLWNTTVKTVMGYINIQSYQASQADHYVECFRHSNYYVQYYKYHWGDSSLTNKFVVFTNSSYSSDTGSYTLNTWEWHHIALVNDIENSKTYGYADGVKIFEWAWAYNFNISDVFLRADRDSSNTPKTWTALLSECIIEDKAWTAQEIQDYYNNTKSTYWS
jgi:hypothetical protein